MMEVEGDEVEDDWLDAWIGSLDDEDGSCGVSRCKEVEDEDMVVRDMSMDFMTWLVEELRQMQVDGDAIDTISEC